MAIRGTVAIVAAVALLSGCADRSGITATMEDATQKTTEKAAEMANNAASHGADMMQKAADGAMDTMADSMKKAAPPSGVTLYTMEDVAKHNTKTDCWTVVDGAVADITSFFGTHPGGDDKLAKACGTDSTALFTAQAKHDPKGYEKLKTMIIGALK